jgi:hypothetical protein
LPNRYGKSFVMQKQRLFCLTLLKFLKHNDES